MKRKHPSRLYPFSHLAEETWLRDESIEISDGRDGQEQRSYADPRRGGRVQTVHLPPVDVAIPRIGGAPVLSAELDVVTLKRAGPWRHGLRSRLIVRQARGLAAGNRQTIRSLKTSTAEPREVAGALAVVVVENLERALALAPVLTDWPILVGADFDTSGLPVEQAEILARTLWQGPVAPARAIATVPGLGWFGVVRWGFVVRADDEIGMPPVLESLFVGKQNGRPLALVVYAVRHHLERLNRSRARRAEYRRRGWTVDGTPALTAVDRLLANRPRRSR